MSVKTGVGPPGEGVSRGNAGRNAMSWAERLGSSLPTTLNKNVLKVVLEEMAEEPSLSMMRIVLE